VHSSWGFWIGQTMFALQRCQPIAKQVLHGLVYLPGGDSCRRGTGAVVRRLKVGEGFISKVPASLRTGYSR
jgi:hypothetical protein